MNLNLKNPPGNKSVYASGNPSILLDKVRRSTPDSEAMVSSDDEADAHRQEHNLPSAPPQKPVRRASWLNDTTQPLMQGRKGSFASSSMSPTASHPSTPSAESGTWNTTTTAPGLGRAAAVPPSFPWGTGIWNTEGRKDPPSRLTEVLPSPTSASGASMFSPDHAHPPHSLARDQESALPFSIPLHPTPKTYRSQSYSVGQLDSDAGAPGLPAPASTFAGRGRGPPQSGLQHRPSRPSMLSEMSNDGVGLAKLNEDEDDDQEANESAFNAARVKMEMLERENAVLRQQNLHSARLRHRSSTNASLGAFPGAFGMQESLTEESDYAIDELDELADLQAGLGAGGRRFSEFSGKLPRGQTLTALENRNLENVKKAYWQSSLGFGGLGDIPQSRRHSFADVPTRAGSISSASGEPLSAREAQIFQDNALMEPPARYNDGSAYPGNDHASAYFRGNLPQTRTADGYPQPYPAPVYQYGMNPQYGGGRPASPHRPVYGMPQPRHNQLLYIVLFKCSRADVFYVQEGTGLSVKPGDLVIVEADRGTDLGTVALDDVDWARAKELKEHYAEEHYKWLMMYSQGAVGTSDGTGAGLMAASNGLQGSAVGGMGPPNQHGMQEPNPGEIKPKIIKRLAQSHEIQALRDKEGNEAKAKRVCMQKVKEHGLHMEILDAEFQMDWKKLTFYYFADAYINFNSLVTDLFKVYKTRIWMSAINPASFATPSLGLQAPSGIGPGAVSSSRQSQLDRRPGQSDSSNFAPSATRGFAGHYAAADRAGLASSAYPQTNYAYGYSPFATGPRSNGLSMGGLPQSALTPMEQYQSYIPNAEYQQGPGRFSSPHDPKATDAGGYSRDDLGNPGRNDGWMTSFQGLSLNSR